MDNYTQEKLMHTIRRIEIEMEKVFNLSKELDEIYQDIERQKSRLDWYESKDECDQEIDEIFQGSRRVEEMYDVFDDVVYKLKRNLL